MKSRVFVCVATLGLVSLCMPSLVAQADEPVRQVQAPLKEPAPKAEGFDQMLKLETNAIEIHDVLNWIAARTGKKVLVAEGVKGRVWIGQGKEMKLSQLLDMLGRAANFSWGRLGNDTILVTPNRTLETRVARPAPELRFERGTRTQPQPDWKPFQFNGGTYYMVPLQAKTDAAPQNKALPQTKTFPQKPLQSTELKPSITSTR